MTADEVAALLGISPRSVNVVLARHGIPHRSGWDRAAVEALKASGYGQGKGRRTDLRPTADTPEESP